MEGKSKKKILIIASHPDSAKSFNAHLVQTTVETIKALGHEVRLVDLH